MEIDKAITGYFAKKKEIEGYFNMPSQLSNSLFKAALYLSYIGEFIGELKEKRETQRAKAYLKHLNEGKSATNAQNLARCEVAEITGEIDKLEMMWKSGNNFNDLGRSRLKVLEAESRNQT